MLDFGAWADEEYALPAEGVELTEEELAQIEQAIARKTHDSTNL